MALKLSELPKELIVLELATYINEVDIDNLRKTYKRINEICDNNEEYINEIIYDNKVNCSKNFRNTCKELQRKFLISLKPDNENKLKEYKFNNALCPYCNKKINYCEAIHKLTFYHQHENKNKKIFEINFCDNFRCASWFIHCNNTKYTRYSKYKFLRVFEQRTKFLFSMLISKLKYSEDGFVKIDKFDYEYDTYNISLKKIEKIALKYLKNQL